MEAVTFAGSLQEYAINDIISLISLQKKTGIVEFKGKLCGKDVNGQLYFKRGNVCYATLLDMSALESALTFFSFEQGYFQFVERVLPAHEDLQMSNETIIMQGIERAKNAWRV